MPISDITREQVRELAYKVRENLSPSGTWSVISVLRSIMNQAVEDDLLPNNPASRPSRYIPRRNQRQKDIDPLTREELSHLLATIQAHRRRYFTFFLLLARTGMRLGEACALKWEDIDWYGRMIHVQRGIRQGVLSTTKSGKTRRVDMSSQLVQALQEWQTQCELEAIERGLSELPEWVFCTSNGRPIHGSDMRSRVWKYCLTQAGLRHVRIHDIRHTYATLLIEHGESLAYIRDQLGHASIQQTVDTYGHLMPGGNRQALDRLDDERECNLSATRKNVRANAYQ